VCRPPARRDGPGSYLHGGRYPPADTRDAKFRRCKSRPTSPELVILVAHGRTNAQIAAQLYISVNTVGSHLERIRDKTGCRRRAGLTRLALAAGLV
jgi:DNA-binding NarL/FixJ family response regulator